MLPNQVADFDGKNAGVRARRVFSLESGRLLARWTALRGVIGRHLKVASVCSFSPGIAHEHIDLEANPHRGHQAAHWMPS